jgi:hypothetical protein
MTPAVHSCAGLRRARGSRAPAAESGGATRPRYCMQKCEQLLQLAHMLAHARDAVANSAGQQQVQVLAQYACAVMSARRSCSQKQSYYSKLV